jgi:hypothetical protein
LSYDKKHDKKLNLRFCGRHIGLPETVEEAKRLSSVSPNIIRKSQESLPLNAKQFGSGSEQIGLWGNFTPWSLEG